MRDYISIKRKRAKAGDRENKDSKKVFADSFHSKLEGGLFKMDQGAFLQRDSECMRMLNELFMAENT